MPVVGLTGGVASGKSFVARCLSDLGCERIDADTLAHEVLKLPRIVKQIVERWGEEVLDSDGQIVRKELGARVFGDKQELDELEAITHPEIGRLIRDELNRFRSDSGCQAIVLDVPLLFEGGWDKECDHVIYVDANFEIRAQRAGARGWAEDEIRRRESQQLATEEKQRRATFVIDNSGTKRSTAEQLSSFWQKIGMDVPERFRELHLDDSYHE